jgi:energy-coupling factor transporter ATP-binding protein EcfA2
VAIARALAGDPHVVLADEPTGQLDQAASDAIAPRRGALAGERTVVVVTHDLGLAARAPRVVQLEDGRVVGDGPPSRVTGLAAVELGVEDRAAAERWYRDVLGLETGEELLLVRGEPAGGRVWLAVSDLARARERLTRAGIEHADTPEGITLRDPDGNPLGLRDAPAGGPAPPPP